MKAGSFCRPCIRKRLGAQPGELPSCHAVLRALLPFVRSELQPEGNFRSACSRLRPSSCPQVASGFLCPLASLTAHPVAALPACCALAKADGDAGGAAACVRRGALAQHGKPLGGFLRRLGSGVHCKAQQLLHPASPNREGQNMASEKSMAVKNRIRWAKTRPQLQA